ncbi:SGNH/GDSL hydrolase family protein [Rhodoligotrophos defluvii]|uniref:SGNH/GDSL hydrolase family protein n=1 Tax=Rhodoligotrophos defluvii TaxID=2561934 RepID=UPI0014855C72|nr:GDSL-type esterase/lipase family protein [Rhodoligotrophos defluvii]
MRRMLAALVAFFAAWALALPAAVAQEQPSGQAEAASTTSAQKGPGATYIPEAHDRYSVLVLGDALAGGLWAGMGRAVKPDDRFQVEVRYREGSGFARSDLYDWLDALPGILDRNQVHAAVVLLGSNDGQDLRVGSERLAFGSPEWKAKYQEVVDEFLAELRKRNIAVYWVGLPPMARPDYDEAMQKINAVVKERAEAVGVKFIDIRKHFSDETGGYTEMGMDPESGLYRRLRDRDGVRFLKRGNTKLASIVLDVLREDVKAAENPPPPAAAAPADGAGEPAAKLTNTMPFFGQPGLKEPIMIQPELPKTARPTAVGGIDAASIAEAIGLSSPGGEAGLTSLQKTAPPGSPAAQLFVDGLPPPSQPGRLDDFSWK